MKITLQKAIEGYISCNNLIKKSFSAKTAIKLLRLQRELENFYNSFNEVKDSTILKYAIKDENGEPKIETLEEGKTFVPVAPENRDKCTKELNEALEEEVDISDITFKTEDFGEDLIVVEELIGLLPFIAE